MKSYQLSLKDFIYMYYESKCIFLHFIDNNNRNKKKKYKGIKSNNSNPSSKIYELLLSFVRQVTDEMSAS